MFYVSMTSIYVSWVIDIQDKIFLNSDNISLEDNKYTITQ